MLKLSTLPPSNFEFKAALTTLAGELRLCDIVSSISSLEHFSKLFLLSSCWSNVFSTFLICTLVAEKKPVLTPSWSCFFDLFYYSNCFCYFYKNKSFVTFFYHCHTKWLTVKLNCLCSEPCPPADGRKEEINISPAWGFSLPSSQSAESLNEVSSLLQPLISQSPWAVMQQTEWTWTQ